jgi:hypothetical protein
VTVLCIGYLSKHVRAEDLRRALEEIHWPMIPVGLVFFAIGYFARIVRWTSMLRAAGAAVRVRQCAAPFLGSIALNNVLPLRAGDVVRAFVFPSAIGVTRTAAAASLLLERLVDLVTLTACLGLGLYFQRTMAAPEWLKHGGATLAIIAVGSLFLLVLFSSRLGDLFLSESRKSRHAHRTAFRRLIVIAGELAIGIGQMCKPKVLAWVLTLSVVAWFGEAGLYYFLLKGFLINAELPSAILVMAITTLSTLVPSSPGYIGPFHLAAFTAARMLNAPPGLATSFAIIAHLCVWVPTSLSGGILIAFNRKLFSKKNA